jgi:phage terminase small subunit
MPSGSKSGANLLKAGKKASLTRQNKAFCDHYVGSCNFNGGAAAIAAGYSEKSAKQIACLLLKKEEVKQYILEQLDVGPLQVNTRIAAIALTTFGDIAEWDRHGVRIKSKSEISAFHKMAIKSIQSTHTIKEDGTEEYHTKVELYDCWPALQKLSKLTGLEKPESSFELLNAINTLMDEGLAPSGMIEKMKQSLDNLKAELQDELSPRHLPSIDDAVVDGELLDDD